MRSSRPKVLWPLLGRPVLGHVLAALAPLAPRRTLVVVGRDRDRIRDALGRRDLTFVDQPRPRGTADAVRRCLRYLTRPGEEVVVLSGDVPLVSTATLRRLRATHRRRHARLTLLTTVVPEPAGYGRIVRGPGGEIQAVVEERDADRALRATREINVGTYVFETRALRASLGAVRPSPVTGEYYLTDAVRALVAAGDRVATVIAPNWRETVGINTPEQFALSRDLLQDRWFAALRARGVTVVDPATTRIDVTSRVGPGTEIRPFTFIEGAARIGRNCRIGPFVWLAGARIPDREELAWVVLKS